MSPQFSIFDTLLEPVFVVNESQSVIYCNETASIIAGLSIRKITRGMKFLDLFEFSETIDALNNLNTVTDPTPYKEVNFKSTQGTDGKIQITLQPIASDNGEKNWIIFVRDVTLEERLQKKYRTELEQKEGVISALEDAKLQLENYSKNLEKMVAERTQELLRMNQTMTALLDSLGQGFFIFNREGRVLDVSSKACENTIEGKPDGKMIWDVLKLSENKVPGFQKWMHTLFMEMLPFEDLAPLGPTNYPHSEQRSISLEYNPLRCEDGSIDGVVVVASDITNLVEAQKQAEYQKEQAKMIINLVKGKREVLRFINESKEMLQAIDEQMSPSRKNMDSEELYRHLHTLKGGAALFAVGPVATACHEAETLLTQLNESPTPEVKIELQKKCAEVEFHFNAFLEKTTEILGASVLAEERQLEIPVSKIHELASRIEPLPGGKILADELRAEFILESIAPYFSPYNEVMQSLAVKVDKLLQPLQIIDNKVAIVPEIYNSLLGTLVHAFRNAVDHGIEQPDVRTQLGKEAAGQVVVSTQILKNPTQESLVIKIQDDGAGINPEKIREKLNKKGCDTSKENDHEVIQHIFDSQFSTREQVTEISGRGVGMDAIKYAAEELGGKVWVDSVLGSGSTLTIEVPYICQVVKKPGTAKNAA